MLPGMGRPLLDRTISNSSNLRDVLEALGLNGSLKILLDAGDGGSVASASQAKWNDVSGNAYDFFRGADGSSSSDDPTFNGVIGRQSAGEFWSCDGGDFFTYDSSPEAFMSAWHKDGALFTVCGWAYLVGSTMLVFTRSPGISLNLGTNIPAYTFNMTNDTVTQSFGSGTFPGASVNRWDFWGLAVNESASSFLFYLNGDALTFSTSYSSPSVNAAGSFRIGANNSGGNLAPAGTRFGSLAAFSSALSQAQLGQIFSATRGKYGV